MEMILRSVYSSQYTVSVAHNKKIDISDYSVIWMAVGQPADLSNADYSIPPSQSLQNNIPGEVSRMINYPLSWDLEVSVLFCFFF